MNRLGLTVDSLRPFLLAVLIISALAVVFAIYQYGSAASDLQNTKTLEQLRQELDLNNPTNSQIVVVAESRRREAARTQVNSMIIGGLGLVGVGAAWLGLDVVTRRRKAAAPVPPAAAGA